MSTRPFAGDAGYVAAEALMASVILGTALAFGLVAFVKARQIGDATLELRRAAALARTVMAIRLDAIGETSGETSALSWRMDLRDTGQTGRIAVCRRGVHIEGRSAVVREYETATLETCPPKAKS